MKTKLILTSVLSFNLIIGNLFVSGLSQRSETAGGRIVIHTTFSVIAVLLLLSLIWLFQKRNSRLTILFSSVIAAFFVPVISTYVLFVGYGLSQFEFDLLIKGVPYAIITGVVSWFLWLPIGIINSIFFIAYVKKLNDNVLVS